MINSKAFFTREKLRKTIERVSKYRYLDAVELTNFLYKEDDLREIAPKMPTDDGFKEGQVGMHWQGYNKYLWLKFNNITYKKTDKEVVCVFDFGKHVPDGNNEGFEAEAYIDGELYQAIDANHLEMFLTEEHLEKPLNLTFRLWSGLTGGHGVKDVLHKIKTAFIATFDEKVDQFVYLSRVIWETIERLEMTNSYDSDAIYLINLLNEAHVMIDFHEEFVNRDKFLNSIHAANEFLLDELAKKDSKLDVTVNAVGHTHIDIAWLWQLKHTREKAQRSFSTVFRLMERYPEYKFMQTQAQIYYHLKKDNPKMYEKIKELVKKERWDVEGSMWVESDCNIPSGESLVRQVMYGKNFFKKEFDVETKTLWLPDVFGYSWALPQILRKANINTFMTTKISWNEYNRLPHDTFIWRGIDGSEILTHCITTPMPYQPVEKIYGGYNAVMTPFTVEGLWRKYNDKEINNEVLMSYGFGDGGGGVNREMLENRRYINMMPGMPKIETTRASDYFKKLHNIIDSTDKYVHTWNGELYFEYHRGTYTSQASTKKHNRKLEFLYRKAEMLEVMNSLENNKTSEVDLFVGWEKLLTNQFHDIIPGTSITEVYVDAEKDYKEARDIATKAINLNKLNLVNLKDNSLTVFNDSTFTRDDHLFYETKEKYDFYNGEELLESQETENGYIVFVKDIKPLSFINITKRLVKEVKEEKTFSFDNNVLETPYYTLTLNDAGQIEKLFDKNANRLVGTNNLNELQIFNDLSNEYDAWNIDIYYQENMRVIDNLVKREVVENGNLRFVIRQTWEYQKSTITQDLIVYKNSPRIDFKTNVDWQTQNQLLKAAFPVDIQTTKATYDIQFGNVERPNHWNTSWDLAKFEVVAHKWANLSEATYNVSLMNDSKYGYDIKDNVMRLTLLRGNVYPDPFQDQGSHEFTYSLYPRSGALNKVDVEQVSYNLNNELLLTDGYSLSKKQLFKIDSESVVVDAIKIAEDKSGIILRMHEFEGGKQNINVTSDYDILSFEEVNLLEESIGNLVKDIKLSFTIKPFEIKTYKIKFK